jgi:hypothetical protein
VEERLPHRSYTDDGHAPDGRLDSAAFKRAAVEFLMAERLCAGNRANAQFRDVGRVDSFLRVGRVGLRPISSDHIFLLVAGCNRRQENEEESDNVGVLLSVKTPFNCSLGWPA